MELRFQIWATHSIPPTQLLCISVYLEISNIFLQKYLRKVAELVYIVYITPMICLSLHFLLHMPKTEFNYSVSKLNLQFKFGLPKLGLMCGFEHEN